MPYVVAALVIVGGLCTLDLVLTLAVIRRLRHHTELLSAGSAQAAERPADVVMLEAGQVPADFVAETVDGERVSRQALLGDTMVGFFTAHCQPCKERAPQFIERAATLPAGRDQSLAVVIGDDTDAKELAEVLSATVRVVREQPGDAVSGAFKVHGYPALCVLDDQGVIKASGFSFDQLRSGLAA
jgi:hypothetical protein